MSTLAPLCPFVRILNQDERGSHNSNQLFPQSRKHLREKHEIYVFNSVIDNIKETIQERTIGSEIVSKFFSDSENTMAMISINKLTRHISSGLLSILNTTRITKSAFTSKSNGMKLTTSFAAV